MLTVGLTGSSGSGKGYISDIFAGHGFLCLDTDEVCHRLYGAGTECTNELAEKISGEILAPDGSVDRKKLGALAFGSDEIYRIMNDVAHRHIKKYTLRWLDEARDSGAPVAVIDAPLLFEAGFDSLCDINVAVTCDMKTRISRITERDGITEEAAAARLEKQKPDPWYVMQADYVIDNSSDGCETLRERVDGFCEMLYEISRLDARQMPVTRSRRK